MEFGRKWIAVGALAAAATLGAARVATADDSDDTPRVPATSAPQPGAAAVVVPPGDGWPAIDVTTCEGWFDDWDDAYPDYVEEHFEAWDDRCDDLDDDGNDRDDDRDDDGNDDWDDDRDDD